MHYSADSSSTPLPNYVSQMRTAAPLEDTHISASNIPVIAEYWLWLTSSMTKAIAEKFGAMPTVTVLSENTEQVTATEARWFAQTEPVFARHILLSIKNQPLVMARTVTPESSPDVAALQGLLERPLAELLFTDARWQRLGDLQPLQLDNGLIGRSCLWQQTQTQNSGLLVEEFFLPELYEGG